MRPDHRPTAPPRPPRAPGEPDNDKQRIKIIIGIAVLLAGFGVMAFLFFDKGVDIGREDGDSPTSFFSYIPIWIAIFIPFIIAKKKKKLGNKPTEDQKRILGLIVAGSVLLVLFTGGLVFLTAAR